MPNGVKCQRAKNRS